ncbi:MAG: hypothetical protein K2Y22_15840 [Candidatus Obscuribacterales bacterium]|nr:hypothetical protein [Candidatus Obscuribacterales bacterium]
MSASEVHTSFGRTAQARLFEPTDRIVKVASLEEFMFHGLQYVFLGVKGELTRGMPTSIAAPPLVFKHFDEPEIPPVWPHPMGLKRGYAIQPLHKRAPDAAAADGELYELLALTDALREGTPRVRNVAMSELKEKFAVYKHTMSLKAENER